MSLKIYAELDESKGLKKKNTRSDELSFVTCALYKFVRLDNFEELKKPLFEKMLEFSVFGTFLLAREGINGTVAGSRFATDSILKWLSGLPGLNNIEVKRAFHSEVPFNRAKVKLKREIVSMGVKDIDPNISSGTYVDSKDWNRLIEDPNVLVIDTRNDYEVSIGTFEGSINPQTKSFRDFPDWASQNLDPDKHKKIAMFCTGGIRCEKSTALLKKRGFNTVYHLQGGILKYLEDIPSDKSLWNGECFVFDNRVAVDHQLNRGTYDQCFACRMPITGEQKNLKTFVLGESCCHCFDSRNAKQKKRTAERQKQIVLAKQRGEAHIGLAARKTAAHRRSLKKVRPD